RSRGVFNGTVVVHPDAQKSEAHQSNHNLLLSGEAEIDTKPELEILADDVKCGHGANAGALDEDALFYLRARGLGSEAARSLLIEGFVAETIEAIEAAPVREHARRLVLDWLPAAGRKEAA
ncbi:MAG: SufD family Fe-S cluster assembly protein, partial [Alphaproteobacteria bacterium]